MIDKQQVKLHFSKNASSYNQYAHVQKKMKAALIDFMLQSNKANREIKNILEIGCGTGYLTSTLIELFPTAQITGVDIAPGMIKQIQSQFKKDRAQFICGDIEEMELKKTYDLIISNATFQWFNDLGGTLQKLYAVLNPKGIFCFSTFGQDTFCELKACFEQTKQAMSIQEPVYAGQSFFGRDELYALCKSTAQSEQHDEALVQARELFEYEYFDSCIDFFYSIKKIGANNSNKSGRCTSPAFIKKVIEYYNENFKEQDQVKATYHCLFYKIIK